MQTHTPGDVNVDGQQDEGTFVRCVTVRKTGVQSVMLQTRLSLRDTGHSNSTRCVLGGGRTFGNGQKGHERYKSGVFIQGKQVFGV